MRILLEYFSVRSYRLTQPLNTFPISDQMNSIPVCKIYSNTFWKLSESLTCTPVQCKNYTTYISKATHTKTRTFLPLPRLYYCVYTVRIEAMEYWSILKCLYSFARRLEYYCCWSMLQSSSVLSFAVFALYLHWFVNYVAPSFTMRYWICHFFQIIA